jgi:hypothetical protein
MQTRVECFISLTIARVSLVSDIPAGDGKITNLFLQCKFGIAVCEQSLTACKKGEKISALKMQYKLI